MIDRFRRAASAMTLFAALGCQDQALPADAGLPSDGGEEADASDAGLPDATPSDAGPRVFDPVPASQLCARLAEATCDRKIRCRLLDEPRRAACVAEAQAACGDRYVGPAAGAGRVAFDEAAAGACVVLTGEAPCHLSAPPAECAEAVRGLGRDDAPCYLDVECADGRFCFRETSVCPGRCVAFLTSVGAACDWNLNRCEPRSLKCDYTLGYICQRLAGAGETCTWAGDCRAGMDCPSGTCAVTPAPAGRDEACATQGSTPLCAAGLFCRRVPADQPGICQPQSAEGGACTGWDQCQLPLFCTAGLTIGTCEARHAEGTRCVHSGWCREQLWCDTKDPAACRPFPAVGESCDGAYVCREGNCDFAAQPYVCRGLLVDGSPCFFSAQCASERCGVPDAGTAAVCLPACTP